MEEPFFFEDGDKRLFGVAHTPRGDFADKGFVLVHPFGEEKLWSHRVYVNFAREAALRGFPVLRFDLSGHGDSSGRSENSTISSYIDEIGIAQSKLRALFPSIEKVGLLGLRLGATLALMSASRTENLSDLILWEPISNGARYMQELLRINLSTQLAIYGSIKDDREALVSKMQHGNYANVDGYLISQAFFEDCSNIEMDRLVLQKTRASCLVTQIAPNIKQKDRQELVELADALTDGAFLKVEEPPFWREIKPFCSRASNLVGATLDFVERKHGD